MKCPNCFNDIDRNLSECPYCGNINLDTFEMPILKDEDIKGYKPEKPKKIEIEEKDMPVIENTEDNNVEAEVKPLENPDAYAEFDFTKEQEMINPFDEANEEKEEIPEKEEIGKVIIKDEKDAEDYAMKLPFKKKLISVTLIVVAIIFLISLAYFIMNDKGGGTSGFNTGEVPEIIDKYYQNNDNSKLDRILENVNDEDTEKEVQSKTKEALLKHINDELNKDHDNDTEFNKTVEKLKTTISTIYNYRLKNKSYSLLKEEDYNELINSIENLKISNNRYFNAEQLYEKKDYDKAYKELSRISSANAYYTNSQQLKKKIISDILEIIKNDVSKLTTEELTDEQKADIRELFKSYCELYPNVPLNTDEAYIALYNQYK